ncbi:uncharacterized protein [Nicotiana sylvestris]|uniref:Uncharacterized protein LOC104211517 n=1 Tax=Nicotiana sylvestris TaxID=4096 RepID=A0A1U7US23_NICSY|nr:PREDICTED: uncharacterized protein LOC104211517 [Nicotiana sylvestris]
MDVTGVSILYATLNEWLGVDSTGAIKATYCKKSYLKHATKNFASAVKEHVASDEGVFNWYNNITAMSLIGTKNPVDDDLKEIKDMLRCPVEQNMRNNWTYKGKMLLFTT